MSLKPPAGRWRRRLTVGLFCIIAYEIAWLGTVVMAWQDLDEMHYQRFAVMEQQNRHGVRTHFFRARSFHDAPNPYRVDLDHWSYYTVSYPRIPAPFIAVAEHKIVESCVVIEHARVAYLWTPWQLYEVNRTELDRTIPGL